MPVDRGVEIAKRAASIRLDILINAPHKERTAGVAQRAAHQGEPKAEHAHVPKVEDGLEEARHLRLDEEVVDRVEEDVDGRRSGRAEGCPRPPVVLVVEEEVGDDDRDADGHNREDDEDKEHEAVHVVKLVVPEGGEDKVHFDEDGAKWQHAAEANEHRRPRVPPLLRYQARDRVDSAREVGLPGEIAAQYCTEHAERQRDQEPDEHHREDRGEGRSGERLVQHGDHVEDEHDGEAGEREDGGGHDHRGDP
mmetsp:Transcript_34350/g.90314  ORF Transcript_34350/g.90314 Transcript_34350/m.90314 type:complete len:251 (-) Transcript_34350:1126-1878(-)